MPFVNKIAHTNQGATSMSGPTYSLSSNISSGPRWSFEEERLLQEAVLRLGTDNWEVIATHLRKQSVAKVKRTGVMCEKRWQQIVSSGVKRGHWTLEEDSVITEAVNEQLVMSNVDPHARTSPISCIDIKWSEVSKKLSGLRTGKQCRERYSNHLDPTLKKSPWSAEEDMQLIKIQATMGNSWTKISMEMPGRSENEVKNRWYSVILRRYGDDLAYYQSLHNIDDSHVNGNGISAAGNHTKDWDDITDGSNVLLTSSTSHGSATTIGARGGISTNNNNKRRSSKEQFDESPESAPITKMKRSTEQQQVHQNVYHHQSKNMNQLATGPNQDKSKSALQVDEEQDEHDNGYFTNVFDDRSISMLTTDSIEGPSHPSVDKVLMNHPPYYALQNHLSEAPSHYQSQPCYLDTMSTSQQYHGHQSHYMMTQPTPRHSHNTLPTITTNSNVTSGDTTHSAANVRVSGSSRLQVVTHTRPLSPHFYDRIFDSINTYMTDAYHLLSRLHRLSKDDLTPQDIHILHYAELYNKWRREYIFHNHYHHNNNHGSHSSHTDTPTSNYTVDSSCMTSPDCNGMTSLTTVDATSSLPTSTIEDLNALTTDFSAATTAMRKPTPVTSMMVGGKGGIPKATVNSSPWTNHPMIVVPALQHNGFIHNKMPTVSTADSFASEEEEMSIATFLYSRLLGSNRTSAVCSTTNSSTASIEGDFKHLLDDDSPLAAVKREKMDEHKRKESEITKKRSILPPCHEIESTSFGVLSGDISLSSSPGWDNASMSGPVLLSSSAHNNDPMDTEDGKEEGCIHV